MRPCLFTTALRTLRIRGWPSLDLSDVTKKGVAGGRAFLSEIRRVAEPLISWHNQEKGCPTLRFVKGGKQNVQEIEQILTPRGRGTKSLPIPHSPEPFPARPEDKRGNCSSATPREPLPDLASPDCDAYTSASPPASLWSKR